MRVFAAFALGLIALSGCETPPPPQPQPVSQPVGDPVLWDIPPRPVAYDVLPGWTQSDLLPGLAAFKRSCTVFAARPQDALLSPRAPWAGTAADWAPACAALDVVGDGQSARAVLQALFTPVEIQSPQGESRFTGYFEPMYAASLVREPPYTEPVPARPDDLITVSGEVYQRRPDGSRRPYPSREEITRNGVRPLAYAHPGDVFFLQIQGSGRLILPNGETLRAVYAANNGQPFKSTANWLMARGWITRGEASMTGIRAWMDRASPAQVREAMNANPRFVFFDLEPEGNPALGPKGALGVSLTPLGSMAVDLNYHANGVPMFIQTSAPGLGGVWSGLVTAQDTGGAIKGPVRGDLYFGTGPQAGAAAETVNTSGRMWVLLPRGVADRLRDAYTRDDPAPGRLRLAP